MHKKKVHKYCSNVLPFTSIQNFSLFTILSKTVVNVSFLWIWFALQFDSSNHQYLRPASCIRSSWQNPTDRNQVASSRDIWAPMILDHPYQFIFHRNFHLTKHELLLKSAVVPKSDNYVCSEFQKGRRSIRRRRKCYRRFVDLQE